MKFTKFIALIAAAATLFAGCEPTPQEDPVSADAKLSVLKSVLEVNTPIVFIVEDVNGNDVTAESVIFDATTFDEVSNPFTPTADGKYKFYAVYGDAISNYVDVVVTPTVPALPEDAKPENTEFKHRILLVDHTGTECGYCPKMMMALKEVAETGDYHSKYYEAIAHSYNQSDPASSSAAFAVSGHHGINNYPTLTYNFYHPTSSSYNAEHIKSQINALWKEYAEVSVAATTSLATKSVVVNTEIKAAVSAEYSINAWLLEDGIEAKQTNATAEWMNIHNNAIRNAATTEPLTGYELGTIEAGKCVEQVLSLDITSAAWNRDNLKVMLIVSKKNDKGKYDVANVAICPLNQSITYDYK
ncbi:MAG: Omp28-related outer membrane protein [Alistipes sp.]|nr:Omp28-related outer membrane protein [Alistipes sp.]